MFGPEFYEGLGNGPLAHLPRLRHCRSRRVSSWDRSGGNRDRLHLQPGEELELAAVTGAGCVRHVWMTLASEEAHFLRKVVLRAYWDGEAAPSIEVPVGDFFGVGFAITRNYAALPLAMSPEDGRGFSCYFPMPFGDGARITATSECATAEVLLYYHVDYEQYDNLGAGWGRFHAQWRRQCPCGGVPPERLTNEEYQAGGSNLTGDDNYVVLEADGWGHYVGCVLNVANLRETEEWNWFGEGDDMIFVDGEPFPPSLHGTGTEDYFNMAWCPTQAFSGPYHGMPLVGQRNWAGRWSMYRFHLDDPVHFRRSLRVTIEHGHANRRSDDFSSVAYWYQAEPHRRFPLLPRLRRGCDFFTTTRNSGVGGGTDLAPIQGGTSGVVPNRMDLGASFGGAHQRIRRFTHVKRFVIGVLMAGAILAASVASAAAAPIYCPGGQTAEKTSSGWACVNSGDNSSGAGWHKGTNDKI